MRIDEFELGRVKVRGDYRSEKDGGSKAEWTVV